MKRLATFLTAFACAATLLVSAAISQSERPLTRIAFGSCAVQTEPQPIWEKVLATKPDLFISLGDLVYAKENDPAALKRAFDLLMQFPGFRRLKQNVPFMAVWDDGELGVNDAWDETPHLPALQRVFHDFLGVPADLPRRTRDGVYDARIFGPPGRRVQVILLDTRTHRSRLQRRQPYDERFGRYEINPDPSTRMMDDAQWRWLEEQLGQPAEVRLIASGVQVIAEDHGWEKWANFPHERERLYELLRRTGATGVILLSGDRHLAELSMMDAGLGYPLYDLTASGLNAARHEWRPLERNRHRLATMNWDDHFGMITFDWSKRDPVVGLQIIDSTGDVRIHQKVPLSVLRPHK